MKYCIITLFVLHNITVVVFKGTYKIYLFLRKIWGSVFQECPISSLIGTPANWLLNPDFNRSNMDEIIPSAPPNTMASLFKNDDQVFSVSNSPQTVYTGNIQIGATLGANLP